MGIVHVVETKFKNKVSKFQILSVMKENKFRFLNSPENMRNQVETFDGRL